MSQRDDQKPTEPELTEEELEQNEGEPLPDRETMFVISPGYDQPVPVNPLIGPEEVPDDRLEQ